MKVAVLAGLGLVGQLAATDFRAPIATQMGPLHYSFDKLHKKKSNFTYFTTAHYRETNEAFMKNGTETHPLAQLIFGQPDFTISQAMGSGPVYNFGLTENYNPYLNTTRLAPRVSYSEAGVFFGASWDYPVWHNKGRIGIRGSLPIRYVRMERDNEAEVNAVGDQSDVIKNEVRWMQRFTTNGNVGVAPTLNEPNTIEMISSYRLALLRGLLYRNSAGNVIAAFQPPVAAAAGVNIMQSNYGLASANIYGYGSDINEGKVPFVVIKSNEIGEPPFQQGGALLVAGYDAPVYLGGIPQAGELAQTTILYPQTVEFSDNQVPAAFAALNPAALAVDGSGPDGADKSAIFVTDVDYNNLDLAKNSDLWVTTVHAQNAAPIETSQNAVNLIDNLLLYYNSDVEQWLADRGFVIATDEQTGLGDIPVELFYEHSFNDKWRGELCFGVLFPSGNGGSDYAGNPFRVQMGKGSHYEIKLGAMAAWQAIRCMNIKLDLSYNFALEATEQRKAAFQGATIKNFGPRADASVDWSYFLGNLDFNFTHPKSKKINGMIGYQLYYKTEDHIDFKSATAPSWLGQQWTDANGNMASSTVAGTQWSPLSLPLSNKVARMDTEQWGHRIRLEGSYNLSKYCTTSVGGLYTFAGQNIPVEADIHCACQVRF